MPIAKALKREAPMSKQGWRTLAKWRNLNRRPSSDQELTSNGWTHLSRCVGLERRRENLMARAARRERNGCSPSLGGLAFQRVFVNPKAPDFRFECRPWNPEFGSRA